MNSAVLRNLSYGVYIVTTLDKERPTGCVANSVMQITSSPATLALSMNHDNYTNACIKECGRFAVSILSENSDRGLIGTFGFQSGKEVDKFAGMERVDKSGVPIITGTCGFIVCEVIDSMESETHTVFLGKIVDGDVLAKEVPMTYAYYHQVVKGKSPKNAPTYIPETEAASDGVKERAVYVCSVCGYVYDGEEAFETLGEDYRCPVCKQPKSKFVKQLGLG